ncbi:MAG: hypothetical protein Q8K63_07595, partial [Acidimicrobiales bacterium]|nr:hypothetical protein [Acidimicrobiales bacterium]
MRPHDPAANSAAAPAADAARGAVRLAAIALSLAALAAYANSFAGVFVLDDLAAIPNNESLRDLTRVLAPPADSTTFGRPIANLSFAIDRAWNGDGPWGYHATNLLIHLLAALTLFGLVRRTLSLPRLAERFGADALPLALAAAALWMLHPLQTESVTYVVQRVESLAGLLCLATLYAFVRGVESASPARWFGAAVLACLLAMGSKESAAAAPLLVLLYDRTLVAGSFR